jgi:uncharacterized protein (TIGR03545 family)
MIRWRFVITRLVVIVAILFLIALGMGPIAHYVTVRGLEAVTGAKVQVASTKVNLLNLSIRYEGVQVADPRDDKAYENLVAAESIEFSLDGRELMSRRWVADTAKITGLEIGSKRNESGHYDTQLTEPVDDSGPSALTQWIAAASGQVGDSMENFRDELETVRRSKAIRAQWETQYVDQVARAKSLEDKVRSIRDRIKGIDNPLRDYAELQRTMAESKAAAEELGRISNEIKSLPQKWRSDMASMEEAKQIDMSKIKGYLPGDFTEADRLGIDLVKQAVVKQIATVRSYLDGGKALADYTVMAPDEIDRTRGENYDFDSLDRPELMIRKCLVSGMLRADGKIYRLDGWVDNLTPTPERAVEPMIAKMRLEGPDTVQVQYARDRRGGNEIDMITLHWPTMDGDSMRLGKPGEAMFAVNGGNRELWIQVRAEGEDVTGHLISKQTGVHMTLDTDEKVAKYAAVQSLAQSLGTIDQICVDAKFEGTWDQFEADGSWDDLNFKINTNLGRELQAVAKDAIAMQVTQTRDQVTGEVNKVFMEQQAELNDWIAQHESKAQELVAKSNNMLNKIGEQVVSEVGQGDVYIGRLQDKIKSKLR